MYFLQFVKQNNWQDGLIYAICSLLKQPDCGFSAYLVCEGNNAYSIKQLIMSFSESFINSFAIYWYRFSGRKTVGSARVS